LSEEPPNPTRSGRLHGGPFGRLFSARPEGSVYPKAEPLPRLLARVTDFILAALLVVTAGLPGGILAVLYLLFADGLFRGQSPGKRLLGIKVMHLPSRREADFRESALRNFPFALAMLLRLVPGWGDLLFAVAGAATVLSEGVRVLADKLGLRLGDLFASSQVVDTKVLAVQRPKLEAVRSGPSQLRGAARASLGSSTSTRQAV
jgi:uncharacterized RDD family membrane protein YckC